MRRTQLYLSEDIWKALRVASRQRRTTVSELVREAVRDKFGPSAANRAEAMAAWVGLWRERKDLRDSTAYVRRLRKGKRVRRFAS